MMTPEQISRRGFLRMAQSAAGAGVAVGTALSTRAHTAPQQAERRRQPARPNVLVFFTDQQRWDTAGCYGNPMGLTPNLDAFARQGVLFRNAFTCQPVCAPARACLQTGRYATANTVWRNGIRLPNTERTLAHAFKEAGYRVGYIGKWHLAGTDAQPVPPDARGGYVDLWEAADALESMSHPYQPRLFDANGNVIEMQGYRVDALTERAISFITQPRQEPFFLFLSFLEPHFQNDMHAFVAPEGYAKRYANPWVPPDLQGHPGDWYESLPDYYGCVARLDECLGRVMDAIKSSGLAENTIVLFTSDHGCHFRTRNEEYKRSCHESSIRIPAAVWGPGLNCARVVDEMVSLVDLPAILLDAAGLDSLPNAHGRSVLPLLKGPDGSWQDDVFIQISEAEVGRAVRTARWKYAVYAPDANVGRDPDSATYVERYLYDLWADPHEQVNLVGRRDHRKVADEMRERLLARMVAAGERPAKIEPARYPA